MGQRTVSLIQNFENKSEEGIKYLIINNEKCEIPREVFHRLFEETAFVLNPSTDEWNEIPEGPKLPEDAYVTEDKSYLYCGDYLLEINPFDYLISKLKRKNDPTPLKKEHKKLPVKAYRIGKVFKREPGYKEMSSQVLGMF